jgi:hypothetical protein
LQIGLALSDLNQITLANLFDLLFTFRNDKINEMGEGEKRKQATAAEIDAF